MGNYVDKGTHTFDENDDNIRTDIAEDPAQTLTETETQKLSTSISSIEIAKEAGESLDYHIFSYKQHMPFKKRQIIRWAAAKLNLTEELIRINQLRSQQLQQCSYLEPETDYLSDDEMEENPVDQQLHSLEKYRTELVQLLGRLSLDARSKTKRKKGKKIKRRKLLSKSSKNKIASDCDNDSEMSDSSKVNSNICRDRVMKRTPFRIKNS